MFTNPCVLRFAIVFVRELLGECGQNQLEYTQSIVHVEQIDLG